MAMDTLWEVSDMPGVLDENSEANRLAAELASLTGRPVEEVVTEVLRERVEAERARVPSGERPTPEDIINAAQAVAAQLEPNGMKSADHAEMLYDERGLPK